MTLAPANGPVVEVRIRVHPDGRLEVAGPVDDRVVMYGLLELAKDELRRYWRTQDQRVVVPAVPADLMRPS